MRNTKQQGQVGVGAGRPQGFEGTLLCHRCDYRQVEHLDVYTQPYRFRVVGFAGPKMLAGVRYFDTMQEVDAWRVGMRARLGFSIPTVTTRSDLPFDFFGFDLHPEGDFDWPFDTITLRKVA